MISAKPALLRFSPVGIALAAIAAVAYQLYGGLVSHSYQPVVQQQPPVAVTKPQPAYQVATITDRHLFGQLSEQFGSQPQQQNLPETQLQLVLRGAFTANDTGQGAAIIESMDQEARSYRVGQPVAGGVKLHAVYNDRVVLAQNGQLETLYFPSIESVGGGAEQEPIVTALDTTEPQPAPRKRANPATMTSTERENLIRQRLLELRERVRSRQ